MISSNFTRTPITRMLALLGLTFGLAACGNAAEPAEGGRPTLPTGMSVTHAAAPANTYLLLLSDATGEQVYQQAVTVGATSTEISSTPWVDGTPDAQPVSELVPASANYTAGDANTGVALYHWAAWHDANANGEREEDELLDVMTHDRVAYAAEALSLSFQQEQPKMQQHWNLAAGWSRAEHYVYLPEGSDTYQRLFETAATEQFKLHAPTPITSQ